VLEVLPFVEIHAGPAVILHVKGPTPPVSGTVVEYARPTFPTFRLDDEIVIVGGGTRLIVREADLFVSATDVAVTLTLVGLVTEFGAV
jgi:hypothetical protein